MSSYSWVTKFLQGRFKVVFMFDSAFGVFLAVHVKMKFYLFLEVKYKVIRVF
ncbi:hypothetical protein Bca4012_067251 [Brassica carinata]